MPTYKVTAWICPPHMGSIEIEANSAAEAIEKAKADNCAAFNHEPFEDCGDWPPPDFIRADMLDADGNESEEDGAEEDLDNERIVGRRAIAMNRKLRDALRAIAALPDNKTGDRGPIKQARHIAKCALSEIEDATS